LSIQIRFWLPGFLLGLLSRIKVYHSKKHNTAFDKKGQENIKILSIFCQETDQINQRI